VDHALASKFIERPSQKSGWARGKRSRGPIQSFHFVSLTQLHVESPHVRLEFESAGVMHAHKDGPNFVAPEWLHAAKL
jgi:hypothetical protein